MLGNSHHSILKPRSSQWNATGNEAEDSPYCTSSPENCRKCRLDAWGDATNHGNIATIEIWMNYGWISGDITIIWCSILFKGMTPDIADTCNEVSDMVKWVLCNSSASWFSGVNRAEMCLRALRKTHMKVDLENIGVGSCSVQAGQTNFKLSPSQWSFFAFIFKVRYTE